MQECYHLKRKRNLLEKKETSGQIFVRKPSCLARIANGNWYMDSSSSNRLTRKKKTLAACLKNTKQSLMIENFKMLKQTGPSLIKRAYIQTYI